jgi:ABC-type multidrug transport system ATPase subunit
MSFILGTIGDVKVLLLDEPCTGLDPVSRAMVWKEIEHLKKDRVIVLTTHDMEEAEYLSDSIMMLADGILIAEGSPLAIKSACGNNLNLHLTRKKDSPIQTSLTAIRLWTQASIPGSTAVIDMDEETETLQIPRNQLKLLADFTTMIEKESILNWSLKNITMEEAFLTIINLDEDEFKAKKDDPPVVYEAVPLIPFAEFLESADIAESVLTDSEKDVIPDAALFTVEFEHGIMQQLRSQRYKVLHLAVGNWPSFAMIVVAYLWIIILTQAIGKSLGLDSQGVIRFGLILSTPFFAELIIVNRNSKMLELELTHGLKQAMFWPALYWATFATSSIFSIFALYPFAIIRGQKEKVGTGLLNGPYILSLFVLCGFIGHASGSCAVFFGCVFRSKLALIFIWSILCISILVNFENDWMSLFPFVAMYNFLKVNDQPALLSNAYWHLVKGFFGGLGLAIFGIGFDFVLNNKPKPRARTPKKVSQAGNNDAVVKMERIDAGVEKANEEIAELFRNNTVVPNEHLRIAKVCKNYGSHIAVNELSMRLFRDETFVILGENGSGKSTTFGMIQGTIKPTSGSISVNSKIAICKQHDMLWDNMSVNHHMRYFSMLNGVPEDDLKQWFEKIKAFGLITDSMMHQYPSDLSGGMRRRLSVALSMIGDADVLLLDEPSTGLDPKNRNQLWDSIFNIRKQKGKSIILSTHSMQEADALSDRIGVMKDGRLIALGTKNDLNIRYGNMMKVFYS